MGSCDVARMDGTPGQGDTGGEVPATCSSSIAAVRANKPPHKTHTLHIVRQNEAHVVPTHQQPRLLQLLGTRALYA
jgi:hypothetical protein